MNRETRAALDKSIEHWAELLTEGGSIHGRDCALCRISYDILGCPKCPMDKYGMQCNGKTSPWADVFEENDNSNSFTLPPAAERTEVLQGAVEVMLMCLLMVRGAEKGGR